jgi:exopolysaccharide biosynthesis polyprenyl glycosylphosphotransferase
VNGTEKSALLQGVQLYDELASQIDEQTFKILERRRRTATVHRRGWLVRRMLVLADIVGLATAFLLAEFVFAMHTPGQDHVATSTEFLLFLLTLPGWVLAARLYGLYERDEERTDHSTSDDVAGVFHLITVCSFIFLVGSHLTHVAHPTSGKIAVFWGAAIVLVSSGRALARVYCRRHTSYLQNAVIVGAGDVGQLVGKKLQNHPEYGINLVGFVDDAPKERRGDLDHFVVLGPVSRLPGLVRFFDIERVVIAFSQDSHERTLELVRSLKDLDVQVDIVPRLFELLGPHHDVHSVEGLPLLGLPPLRLSRSSKVFKRTFDLAVTLPALIVLSPAFLIVAALIKRDSQGPVFFRQTRMGWNGQTFTIWKFRTMGADADARKHEFAHLNEQLRPGGDPRMFKIYNDPRETRVGRWLRRHSIDELPQLFNVVRGEMSLVGPRPLILDEDQHVSAWARDRLNLKPGCTGPWQVAGGSGVPFDEMVRLDYHYVTGWSLFNDVKLLLRTLPAITRERSRNSRRRPIPE